MHIRGKVEKGDGYGRTIGFPTVNIDRNEYKEKQLDLEHGVYAGFVKLEATGKSYRAGLVVGPKDATGFPKLEAHLIDFSDDLYGASVTLYFLAYVRSFKSYVSEEDLKTAIAEDIKAIQSMDICLPE